ncbi:MAG TPA: NUDIX domain-containing protein [Tepidiformaceae bacterium]|nr:NUDIX domain-containing protein [Tepidiformaceae bacterium]
MPTWQDRYPVIAAAYIILRREDHILFLHRANTGYRDGEYSLPAGHLDGGESALAAAIREAREETGITLGPANLRLVHTQHRVGEERDHERINLYFEATNWLGEPTNAEPHKCTALTWASPADPPQPLVPEIAVLLEHLASGSPFSTLGFGPTPQPSTPNPQLTRS